MTTETGKSKKPKDKKITFKCKFCDKSKPLDQMVVLTKYFPPVITCRDCEKKMR